MRIFLKEDDFFVMDSCTEEEYQNIIATGYREVDEDNPHYIKQNEKINSANIIAEKMEFLRNTDYKILKCYEAYMSNETLPYDFEQLKIEREEARQVIRVLTGEGHV